MTGIALALALGAASSPAPPSWYSAWRIVDRPALHVGVRPAAYVTNEGSERAAGVTVQVSWLGAI